LSLRVHSIGENAEPSDETNAAAPAETTTASGTVPEGDLRARIAALEAQALRYETAIDNISPAVCFFDGEERLILCNRRYAEMYRLAPEQLRPGITLEEILQLRLALGTAAITGVDGHLARARSIAAGVGDRTWTVDLEDGRTIQMCHQPVPDGWVVTQEDISVLRAKRTVESERVSLQALIDAVPDYLWVKDAESRFVVVNRALASDSGRAKTSDMVGLSDFDLHAPEAAREFRALEQDVVRTGRPMIDREESTLDAGGARNWLLSTKMPLRNDREEIFGLVGISRNITDRVRAADELQRAQEFLHLVVESVPDAILVKDVHSRRFTMLNRAAEDLIGMPRADVLGRTADAIYPPDYAKLVWKEDEELLQAGELFLDNHTIELRGRESRIVTINRKLLRDGNRVPQFMVAVIHDITERKRAEERIAHLAHHDPLTDLPNRASFNERLAAALQRRIGSAARFAVLCIDLDRLKEVNDVFGHAAGDRLLCEVSRRLLAAAGNVFLARLGGDEFALIAETVDQPSGIAELTDRLLAAAESDLDIEGSPIRAGLSIGVAVFPDDGRDATTLLANADAALYRAKAEGRGVTRFFKADMDKRLRERHALRHDLGLAIERGELALFYQPQARVTGEIVSFEALLRWRRSRLGPVAPSTFIPIAEESRLIVQIGEWTLREVCREAASWPQRLGVAVNLSPVQFQHGDLPSLVHSILLETGLAANRLELEITEGVLMTDSPRALSVLRRLKALGVRIAMDDFGKGYSSLSYLQSFPFDKIKIDRAFVSKLERNPQSAAIVRAVLGLARGLGLPVLAEGVETEEELAFLAAEACDQVQGYLIGRPLPIADYAEATGRPRPPSLPARARPRAG
jgi:diguanylate cyclase (GGDEF)-like protein/PAS domain S-box-containing protein